jgi:hypothetical protein
MASKSLRYHYGCQFNHESEGISIPHSNLSYFLGTTVRGAPRMHCSEYLNCRDDPVSGSAMAAHFILPDIHEGPPNLAESNDVGWCSFYVMANAHSYLECITPWLCVRWQGALTLRIPDFFAARLYAPQGVECRSFEGKGLIDTGNNVGKLSLDALTAST